MDPALVTIIQSLTAAVVTAIIGLVVYGSRKMIDVGVQYMTTKIGTEKFGQLKDVASTFVRTLEQSPLYTDLTGEAKLEQAVTWMADYCTQKKLPYDHDFIHKIVEEAVQVMNAGI
jgi:hypothetical protein